MKQVEKKRNDLVWRVILSLIIRLACAAIGVTLSIVWWKYIWPRYFGQVPTFLGISRYQWDTIAMLFYSPVIGLYIKDVLGKYREIKRKNTAKVTPKEFWYECPRTMQFGIFLVATFIAGIFLTFAVGAIIYAIWMVIKVWLWFRVFRREPNALRKSSEGEQ